jgi:EAL and modified HD-GYP domain-containing signal transduction protein
LTTASFLARRPLLGRDGKFAAYLFRSLGAGEASVYAPLLESDGKADPRPVFLEDVSAGLAAPAAGDAKRFVVVVSSEEGAGRMAPLKAQGFSICARVTGTVSSALVSMGAADYIWWDARPTGDLAVPAKASQRIPGRRIAGGVASRDAFADGKELGAQLFEGEWYLRVDGNPNKPVTPAHSTILELVNMIQTEAPVSKIEQALKRDATISFRLLRYINSAGFGLQCEVTSFRHALSILGYQNLSRWLALLLATAGTGTTAPALMREAAARGRMAELIGHDLVDAQERDSLFIVGVFSLLPAILQLPMAQLLDQLNLSDNVTDALLTRQGLYGPILRLAEAVEGDETALIERLASDLQVGAARLNRHHLAALSWAEQLAIQ